jgi:hypothetical protein
VRDGLKQANLVDVHDGAVGDAGEALFSGRVFTDPTSGPAFAELFELELRGVRGYDDEVAAWVASGRTASLRVLELTCEHASDVVNGLSPEAAAALAGAD